MLSNLRVALPGVASGRNLVASGVLFLGLALVGCQAPSAARMAPLDAELDRVDGSGVRYLVIINTSGKEMHHCSFAAFLCNEHDPNPMYRLEHFARCSGSKSLWRPGEEARFRCHGSPTLEFPIVQELTRVDVVGHCDEGRFRQSWRITESENEVRPPGVKARFTPVPGEPEVVSLTFKP